MIGQTDASAPVVAGIEISTDANGRLNLNALHRASEAAPRKAPNKWLSNKSTQELVCEVIQTQNIESGAVVNTVNGGSTPGTYAHKLLAISYAGWINPAFQLKVNQAFLDLKEGLVPPSLSRYDILKLAMESEERRMVAEQKVTELSRDRDALERISISDGSLALRDAAKHLQVRPIDLNNWLSTHKWIYKRAGGNRWIAYQPRIQQGLLVHKACTIERSDGPMLIDQVLVTSKGLAKLAIMLSA